MDPHTELERDVHRALHALPAVRAPRTLAPRVMQAVRATIFTAGYAGGSAGWRGWALQWQLLSLVAASSLVIAIAVAVPRAESWIADLTATRAAAALWEMFVAPLALPVAIVAAVMCTASALLVAAIKHVAFEGREITH